MHCDKADRGTWQPVNEVASGQSPCSTLAVDLEDSSWLGATIPQALWPACRSLQPAGS